MDTKIKKILKILNELYPDPKTELRFKNHFELLIATILSAQTTDKQVNKVTEKLFAKYPSAKEMAFLSPEELEREIKNCGLFRNKSKSIVQTSKRIMNNYEGSVPDSLEELMRLPGVGRKTASVVLANAFNIPAFPVDTHVYRVSRRLGLARGKTPLAVEVELRDRIPEALWNKAHHWLIGHGRNVCTARNPKCPECPLVQLCETGKINLSKE